MKLTPRTLRALATAIEALASAKTLPGISCPAELRFCDHRGRDLDDTYGNNPALLRAVKFEIRAEWDNLRAKALARLEAAVEGYKIDLAEEA